MEEEDNEGGRSWEGRGSEGKEMGDEEGEEEVKYSGYCNKETLEHGIAGNRMPGSS